MASLHLLLFIGHHIIAQVVKAHLVICAVSYVGVVCRLTLLICKAVDYKTDRIRPEGVPARTAYYAAQLRAYAGAMARITARPVCRRVLYFLHCGRTSEVPDPDA